jgi:hypothetical protein
MVVIFCGEILQITWKPCGGVTRGKVLNNLIDINFEN